MTQTLVLQRTHRRYIGGREPVLDTPTMSRGTSSTLGAGNHDVPTVNMDGHSAAHFGDIYNVIQTIPGQEQMAELKRSGKVAY